jgi:adenine-specific DNA-methyltransferase
MSEEPSKVDLASPDLAAEKREAFQDLFPGVLADGVLDATRLGEMLDTEVAQVADARERFGLMWAGKEEAVRSLLKQSRGALVPDLDNSIDFEKAQNVFIEGDNLEVLKLLQKAYNDKVKLIYIDPPYNTGNDFVYNDDFSDGLRGYLEYTGQLDDEGKLTSTNAETAGRRHSKWLSMLYPRLVLARNLLSQDGVIFISIDDNEMTNLTLLLKEVFGEENFATVLVWQKKKKPSFLHKNVGSITEYVLCFLRNKEMTFPFSIDVTTAGKKYPFNNAGNSVTTLTFPAGYVKFGRSSATYEPQDMSEGNIVTRLRDKVVVREGVNMDSFRLEGEWRYSQAKLDEIVAEGDPITISKAPFRPNHVKVGGEVKKMHNFLAPATYGIGTNEDGSAEMERVFGASVFDNPKPTSLISTLVKAVTYNDPDALVLDFFAGSGTTGHAVALLNAEDGGRRLVISVNIPEPTAEDSAAYKAGYKAVSEITLERLGWVATNVDGAAARGLRVFKLSPSGFRTHAGAKDELDLSEATLVDEEPFVEDVAAEVLLKEGVSLDAPWDRHLADGSDVVVADGVAVVVSLDISDAVVDDALALEPRVLVFLEDGFAGKDAVKANAFTRARNAGITMKTV